MKIRINTHGNELPVSHGEWVDLYTAEDVEMGPLDFKIISLGVAMELPEGYYAQVVPRSSTCKNHGIIMANSVGTAPLRNFTPRDSLYVLELCMSGDWVGAESIIRKSRMKVSRL